MTRNDIRRCESYIFTVRIIVCSYNTNGMPDSRVYPVVFNERFNRGIKIGTVVKRIKLYNELIANAI